MHQGEVDDEELIVATMMKEEVEVAGDSDLSPYHFKIMRWRLVDGVFEFAEDKGDEDDEDDLKIILISNRF